MTRLLQTALFAAACVVLPARAQITITQADFEAALAIEGTNSLYQAGPSAALTALAAQTGANQIWDFTGLTYEAVAITMVTRVQPPVPGSDDPHFAPATHIFRVQTANESAYLYQVLRPGAATFLGLVNSQAVIRYLPERVDFVIPYTFGTTWSSTYETQFEPGPGFITTTEASNAVVGWGTLVTPAGSTEALMTRTQTTTTITIPGIPPIVSTSASILFSRYGLLNANIYLDAGGGVVGGDYNAYAPTVATEPPVGAARTARIDALTPNPARAGEAVQVAFSTFSSAPVRLDVFDVLGRHVATLLDAVAEAGPHQAAWSLRDLTPGVYTVRLTADGQTASRRLTVAR